MEPLSAINRYLRWLHLLFVFRLWHGCILCNSATESEKLFPAHLSFHVSVIYQALTVCHSQALTLEQDTVKFIPDAAL